MKKLISLISTFIFLLSITFVSTSTVYALEPDFTGLQVAFDKTSLNSGMTAYCALSFYAPENVTPVSASITLKNNVGHFAFFMDGFDSFSSTGTGKLMSRSSKATEVPGDYSVSGIAIYYVKEGINESVFYTEEDFSISTSLKVTPKVTNLEFTGITTDVPSDGYSKKTGDTYNCTITVKNCLSTLPMTITSIEYGQDSYYNHSLYDLDKTREYVKQNIVLQPKETRTISVSVPVRMNPQNREETTPQWYQVSYEYYFNDGTKCKGHTRLAAANMPDKKTLFTQINYEASGYDTYGYGNYVTGPVFLYSVPEITDSTCSLKATSATYTGSPIKPGVVVKDVQGNTIDPSSYTVAYSNNTGIGTAKAEIRFPYSDNEEYDKNHIITKTFTIKPKTTPISGFTPASDGITVKWNKAAGGVGYKIYRSVNGGAYSCVKTISKNTTTSWKDTIAKTNGAKYQYKIKTYKGSSTSAYSSVKTTYFLTRSTATVSAGYRSFKAKWTKNTKASGYQVQYSTSSTFASGNKTVTITSRSTASKAISSLKGNRKYYVRVRAYKKVGTTKYYSAWSAKKYVTTKNS